MGLPWDPRWLDRASAVADSWHRQARVLTDPLEVHRHPTTIELARELGYVVAGRTRGELRSGAVSS
jgi:hypothetical protein